MNRLALLLTLGMVLGCGARSPLEDRDPSGSRGAFDASVLTDGTRSIVDLIAGGDGLAPPDGFTDPAPCIPMPPRPLSLPTRSAGAPSLAFDGRQYGVLWVEALPGGGCGRGEWSFATIDKSGVRSGEAVSLGPADEGWESNGTLHVIDGAFVALVSDSNGLRAFALSERSPAPTMLSDERIYSHDAVVMADGRLAVVTTTIVGATERVTLRVFDGVGPELWSVALAEPATGSTLAETEAGLTVALSSGFERVLATTTAIGSAPPPATLIYDNTTGGGFIPGFAEVVRLDGGSAVFFARAGERPRPIEMARVRDDGSLRDTRPIGEPASTLWPAAAQDPGTGDVAVLWKHSSPDGSTYALRFRSFDSRGEPAGAEQVVFAGHSWLGCGGLDRMALVSSVTGWGFAATQETADGSQIIFGEVCR